MLSRTLKMALWVAYDHLGKLIVVNLIASGMCVLPVIAVSVAASRLSGAALTAVLAAACVVAFLACFSCGAALACMIRVLIETRDGSVGRFFAGLRGFALRGAALGLCYLFGGLCLLSSVWFYA